MARDDQSWKYVTLELKQHRYLMTGVTAVFTIGLYVTFTLALRHMLLSLSPYSLAQPFTVLGCTLRVPWKAQFRVVLPPRVLMKVSHTTCGIP